MLAYIDKQNLYNVILTTTDCERAWFGGFSGSFIEYKYLDKTLDSLGCTVYQNSQRPTQTKRSFSA